MYINIIRKITKKKKTTLCFFLKQYKSKVMIKLLSHAFFLIIFYHCSFEIKGLNFKILILG
jgi:hypothetical protein